MTNEQLEAARKKDKYGRDPRLMKDFRTFLWALWKHLGLPEPTKVQLRIAYFLQHCENKRRVIEAFRGVGKSWITTAYAIWRLYCEPHLVVMVVSANSRLAHDFTTFALSIINNWFACKFLRSRHGQRQSTIGFDVGPAQSNRDPSVKSVGIFGQLQGPRADLIIGDDVEAKGNADTVAKREKLSELIKEFDAILKPGGETVFLGTPQTESSIYNLLPDRGYQTRVWPAQYPDQDYIDYHARHLCPEVTEEVLSDPSLEGQTTDPERFSNQDLAERRLSYGPTGYARQFMLDTRAGDLLKFPLRTSDWVVMGLDFDNGPEKAVWAASRDTEWEGLPNFGKDSDRFYGPASLSDTSYAPYEKKILVVDPSGRGKDETAWGVLALLYGQIFLLEIGADTRGYDEEVLNKIAKCAKKHKVHKVLYEANFGDGMAGQIMKPIFNHVYPVSIEEVKHHTQKESRIIDTLEPIMNRHKLIVAKDVVEQDHSLLSGYPPEEAKEYSLVYQLSRVTREKGCLVHDDRLDMLAMGVAHFLDAADRDTQDAINRAHDELLEEEARKMEEVAGITRPPEGFGIADSPLWPGD